MIGYHRQSPYSADNVRMIYERRSALSANVNDVRGKRRTTFVNHSDVIGAVRRLAMITDDYRPLLGVIYLKCQYHQKYWSDFKVL